MTVEHAIDVLISPEDYLDGELRSETKHEYVSGMVYAMAETSNLHNQIAGNIFGPLHNRLRGDECQPFNSNTKVRLRLGDQLRFYYPDVQVTCHPNPPDDSFQDRPILVAEVISESTRRVDEGEKRDGYLALGSLEHYLIVESGRACVTSWRRTAEGFVREVFPGRQSVVPLPALGTEIPLGEIYEGIHFPGPVA